MEKTKNIISILSALLLVIFFSSCGKTDLDKEWEEKLKGYWVPTGTDGKEIEYLPKYIFESENNGSSFLTGEYSKRDKFKWEIKRKELNIYYDEAPSGAIDITSDKYGIRTRMRIETFDDTKVSVVLMNFNGYQRTFKLVKSVLPQE
jgi:hypothetical protein